MSDPLRLGVLVSGGGRTLINLADRIEDGSLRASIELVISSRAGATAIRRARDRGFEVLIATTRGFASLRLLHDAITSALLERKVDLVCLCGYLRWFRVDEQFVGRVMNIHPALLPEFGGKGMFGLAVHRAVLEAGSEVSGCTVHFVDAKYDHGPVILQRTCPVLAGDDEHSLAARVFEHECLAYPEAIHLFAEDRLRLVDGLVEIDLPKR